MGLGVYRINITLSRLTKGVIITSRNGSYGTVFCQNVHFVFFIFIFVVVCFLINYRDMPATRPFFVSLLQTKQGAKKSRHTFLDYINAN